MLLSFLLQDAPAQTTNYMVFGYAIIFGVMGLYVLSLYIRRRNLKQDLELLEDVKEG
jgi:hypothetical protein